MRTWAGVLAVITIQLMVLAAIVLFLTRFPASPDPLGPTVTVCQTGTRVGPCEQ